MVAQENPHESPMEIFTRALPESFSFYHLGEVSLDPDTRFIKTPSLVAMAASDIHAVAFSIGGDLAGMLVIGFDRGLDPSTYSEMGNILASQIANRLAESSGTDVMISPPRVLTETQLSTLTKIVASGAPCLNRIYWHRHGDSLIPLHALLLAQAPEELGNA